MFSKGLEDSSVAECLPGTREALGSVPSYVASSSTHLLVLICIIYVVSPFHFPLLEQVSTKICLFI